MSGTSTANPELGPGTYSLDQFNLETKIEKDRDIVSSSFKPAVEKQKIKVNLYDPT